MWQQRIRGVVGGVGLFLAVAGLANAVVLEGRPGAAIWATVMVLGLAGVLWHVLALLLDHGLPKDGR